MPKAAPIKEVKTEETIRIEHIERNDSSVPIGYPYRHPSERQFDGTKSNLAVSPTIEINFQSDSHGKYNLQYGLGHENIRHVFQKASRLSRLIYLYLHYFVDTVF